MKGFRICRLIWIILPSHVSIIPTWFIFMIPVSSGHPTCRGTHLEIIYVNIEPTATIFAEWIGKFLVGFAQFSMLRIFEGLSIFIAFTVRFPC